MKVLFITNYPSPYRVDFFNGLGEHVDLTVSFTSNPENQKHREAKWFDLNYERFTPVFLKRKVKLGKLSYFSDIIPLIKRGFDRIIVGGYSLPTNIAAIEYMRLRSIPFYIEADGVLARDDSAVLRLFKRHIIRSAAGSFVSGATSARIFAGYGASEDSIYIYPFTSMRQRELDAAAAAYAAGRGAAREALGLSGRPMVLYVGQFVPGKGVDVLIRAAAKVDAEFYIVGGTPTQEYLSLQDSLRLTNLHFEGFKTKEELAQYYLAATVFAMPTRHDNWGLVINEAMSYGLPVVSTNQCVAALELIDEGENGYIVPVDDAEKLAQGINDALKLGDCGKKSIAKVADRSIENMVRRHVEVLTRSAADKR